MLGQNEIDGYEEGEEPLVFHHKNGEFRRYEDKKHSDLATGVTKVKPGLFKALISTKGNRFMLLTLAIVAAFTLVYSLLVRTYDSTTVKGVSCALSAFKYEDTVYASVKLTTPEKKREVIEGERNVTVTIIPITVDGAPLSKEEETVTFNNSETYVRRMFKDFDIAKVQAEISVPGEKTVSINTKVHSN